jgi:hypothetical protein
VGAIVEMDRVAEFPEESSICGHELLQSRVRIGELLHREGAGRRMPKRTLHIAIGGGVIAHHHCTGRCRSPGTWHRPLQPSLSYQPWYRTRYSCRG